MGRKHIYDGSSSSSDSDSESSSAPVTRRYRHRQHKFHSKRAQSPPAPGLLAPQPQAAATASNDEKKKKKPKKPPQESIDQIWEKFSQKKFSKALAVLPSAPVPASASGERANELLQAGYERAAEECRRKVRKIISECKRINSRYRDPGWDLVSLIAYRASNVHLEPECFIREQSCVSGDRTSTDRLDVHRTGISSGRRATASTVWDRPSSTFAIRIWSIRRPTFRKPSSAYTKYSRSRLLWKTSYLATLNKATLETAGLLPA